MKKLLVVLAVLFIGILLAGCTTQPAAPTPTPTPTPVPTTVATPVPTTVEPTKVIVVVVKNETTPTPTPTPTPAPTYTITFTQDLTVIPQTNAYIKAGTVVSWKNMDPYKPHGIQALDYTTSSLIGNGVIDIPYGKTFNATFTNPGSYNYATVYQPATTGIIVVS